MQKLKTEFLLTVDVAISFQTLYKSFFVYVPSKIIIKRWSSFEFQSKVGPFEREFRKLCKLVFQTAMFILIYSRKMYIDQTRPEKLISEEECDENT